ncbi:disulfide bond formation protein B [Chachezhania sediminis]|uniref:disulfide bond formation protein B n=1 Tax=Chachezhania sediminis TaxID=2599291 RepID=UPI00131B6CC9|nr:disulfide bond formation protein B [Chachezhania sediminis]
MTRRFLVLLATAGSAALLLGALGFQYIGGLPPCHLCVWQRWPHLAALVIGLIAAMVPGRLLPLLGAAATLTTAGVGLYHTGVERGWWEGPTTCTSGSIEGMSSTDLMAQIMNAPIVQCDVVAWQFLGLSMASWNTVAALVLTCIWIAAALKRD